MENELDGNCSNCLFWLQTKRTPFFSALSLKFCMFLNHRFFVNPQKWGMYGAAPNSNVWLWSFVPIVQTRLLSPQCKKDLELDKLIKFSRFEFCETAEIGGKFWRQGPRVEAPVCRVCSSHLRPPPTLTKIVLAERPDCHTVDPRSIPRGGGGRTKNYPTELVLRLTDRPKAHSPRISIEMLRPNPHRTRDATLAQIRTFFLWCCLHAVWTPPFTSTGPIFLYHSRHCVPHPVWIGPQQFIHSTRDER